MRVAADPAHLESIANRPRVRRWIGGGNEEVRAGSTWGRTVALQWPEGGVVFMHQGDGVYDAHLVFDRPANPLAKVLEAFRYLFTVIRAREVVATVPEGYWHVARIAKAAGMRKHGSQYRLTVREWTQGTRE